MKSEFKYLAWGGVLTLLLLAADQITKLLAQRYLAGTSGITLVPGIFDFYYLQNRGAAFGMMNDCQPLFVIIAVVIIAFAVYVYVRMPADRHYHLLRLVCILIIAGAAGNMIDRIARGYVIDFLYFSMIDFPVFNIADCYVCAGAGLAVLLFFTVYRTDEFAFLKLHK